MCSGAVADYVKGITKATQHKIRLCTVFASITAVAKYVCIFITVTAVEETKRNS